MGTYSDWRARRAYLRDHWVEIASQGIQDTFVYRYYGDDDQLLYVGVTMDLTQRECAHRSSSAWWPLQRRRTVAGPLTRQMALFAEYHAIRNEKPAYNKQRSNGYSGPGTLQWYIEEASEYDALAERDPDFEVDAQRHAAEIASLSLREAFARTP